jgi:hypothetical protein
MLGLRTRSAARDGVRVDPAAGLRSNAARLLIGQIYLFTVISLIVGSLGRGTPTRST